MAGRGINPGNAKRLLDAIHYQLSRMEFDIGGST